MIVRWRRQSGSLTTRLVVSMGGLVIGTAFVLSALAMYLLGDELERGMRFRVDGARAIADAVLQARAQESARLAQWIGADPALVESLQRQDLARLDDVLRRFRASVPTGGLQVEDSSGRQVAATAALDLDGVFAAEPLQTRTRTGLTRTADCHLLSVASVPIRAGDRVLGAVVVALPLDQEFVDRVKASTKGNAWLVCGSLQEPAVWGAATLELDATVADTVLNHASFAAGSSRVDGVSGYGVYAPLVDVSGRVIGMYGIAQPVQDVIAARDSALRLFAGVALVFVLAVLLEAYLLARRITTPLAALTQATRALSDGAPSAPLEISGDDEIAILARSFSAMRLRLAEARDALVREKDRYRDFLAILPHEFKTPLSAAVASLELLETDPDQVSPEQAVLLSSIRRSVVRLQSLVNNLLDGASLQSGQFQVHAEPHDLASIAEQARTFLQPLLDQKHQAVHFSTPETLPRVLADPRRIEQVVINLLSNANKHGPPGEPICIEMAAKDGFVRVAVADRGAGISAQDQARLFERFARTGREGVGLGLAIVKDIVELHRGQVGIESAPGQGTTVWFTLPIASE